ncbi:MAG: hypothetical protein AAFO81_10900 [Pseudomonadota bacterium]
MAAQMDNVRENNTDIEAAVAVLSTIYGSFLLTVIALNVGWL